jgi:hypothetical protein
MVSHETSESVNRPTNGKYVAPSPHFSGPSARLLSRVSRRIGNYEKLLAQRRPTHRGFPLIRADVPSAAKQHSLPFPAPHPPSPRNTDAFAAWDVRRALARNQGREMDVRGPSKIACVRGRQTRRERTRSCLRSVGSSYVRERERYFALRRRPGPWRIRRHRQIVGQTSLDVFLLPAQPVATGEGTQLVAECPGERTRSRQPRLVHVRQGKA